MATFDDDAATMQVQEVVVSGGATTTVTRVLPRNNWLIRVQGQWTDDGLRLIHVTPGGPATRMSSVDGALTNVSLQAGDTIVSINDLAILNDIDWALAMAQAPDHNKVKLTVVDVNSGEAMDWHIKPQQRPGVTPPPNPPPANQPPQNPPPGSQSPPDGKKPVFPIVKEASGARGYAKVTVEEDGVATLYMKVDTPANGSTTHYIATVLITGYKDNDLNNVLSDQVVTHSLTLGSNPFNDSDKDQSWFLPSVKPEDAKNVRHVRVLLERDKSEQDGLRQFIELCREVGEAWDAVDTLYKKVKHSELGQDAAVALAAA